MLINNCGHLIVDRIITVALINLQVAKLFSFILFQKGKNMLLKFT